MTKRREKKSETLEVRLPHAKKKAFQQACADEGITASHAVRTFIDSYLKRSRRMKLKRIAKDMSMTLIRNPIKSSGGIGAVVAATVAGVTLTAGPSIAEDRDAQPIDYPRPVYPIDLAEQGIGAECEALFDVTPEGFVADNLEVECTHPGFVESTTIAVSTLRFEPKIVDGQAVRRKGVVYPIQYTLTRPPKQKKGE